MRKAILFSVLTLSAGGVAAESIPCEMLGDLGRSTMLARQNGVPMQELMKVGSPDPLDQFVNSVTVRAYEQPMALSAKYKSRAIVEFQNTIYMECIKARQ